MEKSRLHHDLKVFSRECSNHCSLCVKQLTGTSKHDFLQNNSCINPLLICKNKSCIQGLQTPPRCVAQKIYQILNTLTFTKLFGFSSIFFIPRHAHSVKCKHDITWESSYICLLPSKEVTVKEDLVQVGQYLLPSLVECHNALVWVDLYLLLSISESESGIIQIHPYLVPPLVSENEI